MTGIRRGSFVSELDDGVLFGSTTGDNRLLGATIGEDKWLLINVVYVKLVW